MIPSADSVARDTFNQILEGWPLERLRCAIKVAVSDGKASVSLRTQEGYLQSKTLTEMKVFLSYMSSLGYKADIAENRIDVSWEEVLLSLK